MLKCSLLSIILLFCISVNSFGQSACDRLLLEAVKSQQTMTVSSQKKAIATLEKAKTCFDSSDKKQLCESQIKVARNIIAFMNKISDSDEPKAENKNYTVPDGDQVGTYSNVNLTFENVYVKFKGKGGEFRKVKVISDSPDWKILSYPSWTSVSRNSNNQIVIEVTNNTTKQERSDNIVVECKGQKFTLVVVQDRLRGFVKLD